MLPENIIKLGMKLVMTNNINVYDGMITPNELEQINKLIDDKGYTFGWKSHEDKEYRHWNCNFGDKDKKHEFDELKQNEIPELLWNIWSRINKKNLRLIRVYSNAYTYGTEGSFHLDSPVPENLTYLIYLNKDWNPDYAGETVFMYNNEIIKAVLPKYGRLVIFPGNIWHAARSVSHLCPQARKILVYKAMP